MQRRRRFLSSAQNLPSSVLELDTSRLLSIEVSFIGVSEHSPVANEEASRLLDCL
jgi:hypothetical protein